MAIAYDAKTTATTGGAASSLTFSHTCTGSNRILFVYTVHHSHLGDMTGVTYGGESMTLIDTNNASANHGQNLWYIIAPDTGANNVIASKSDGSGWIDAIAVSYTGAAQSGQPDANQINAEATTTSYAKSITTVADNSWVVWPMCAMNGNSLTAGANTTLVQDVGWGGAQGIAFAEGGPKTPAGSLTLTVTCTSQTFCSLMASFAPVAGSASSSVSSSVSSSPSSSPSSSASSSASPSVSPSSSVSSSVSSSASSSPSSSVSSSASPSVSPSSSISSSPSSSASSSVSSSASSSVSSSPSSSASPSVSPSSSISSSASSSVSSSASSSVSSSISSSASSSLSPSSSISSSASSSLSPSSSISPSPSASEWAYVSRNASNWVFEDKSVS